METKSTKTFTELFDVILNGDKEESRKAARGVRKLLHDSKSGGQYHEIQSIIENAPNEYVNIIEDWRMENFVVAVSVLYFLHGREQQPDFLFPWFLYLLKNQNGNIRNAARRMMENELGPLTFHIRCPEYEHSKSKSEKSNYILLSLYVSLNELLGYMWEPKYKRYKYVDSLPTGSYKTIQLILFRMHESCGEIYMEQLKSKLR
ncbi:MAG: hypothetical protein Q8P68_00415 [Candidatus Peregrinibacteria bacterium]|nr:hypothetical protein [Candidatus Peregrinibacteria bacterium]